MAALFENTEVRDLDLGEVVIHARIGGEGPPLLLLHGFPQTHAMWHPAAAALMAGFTCVMPDLRGYGGSSVPRNTPDNMPYSKRVMAADMVAVMSGLGHERYGVVGHDRGGRVAYRMALDHPDRVSALAVLDIVPTLAMWEGMDAGLAMKTYHWMMLAQPHPMPETLIGGAPFPWLEHTLASWTAARDLSAFHPLALAEYRKAFISPGRIHGFCNDYRAGATIDREIDAADRDAGRLISCPTLALWGTGGIPGQAGSPLDIWRSWCGEVEGQSIEGGHFLVEENPADTLAALLPFLERHVF